MPSKKNGGGRRLAGLSKIQKEAYEVLTKHPGIMIKTLSEALGCTHSTATHHLNALVKNRLVVREREGRMVRHYLTHQVSDQSVRLETLLSTARTKRVFEYLVDNDPRGMSINQLACHLQIPFNSLKVILARMEDEKLLELERHRGRYRISPLPAFHRAVREMGLDDAPDKAVKDFGPGIDMFGRRL